MHTIKLLVLNLEISFKGNYVLRRCQEDKLVRDEVQREITCRILSTQRQLVSLDSSELASTRLIRLSKLRPSVSRNEFGDFTVLFHNGNSLVKSTGFSLDPSSTRPHWLRS